MSVLVSDSFNRASASTLGTTDSYNGGTGTTWQYAAKGTGTSSFGISSSNTAVSENSTNDSFAYVESGQSDQLQIQVTVTTFASGFDYEQGIYFWITDNNNWFRFIGVGTTKLYLQKCVSGTVSSVANFAVTNANGDIVQVQLSSGVVTAYHNGTSIGTYTAGTQTATKHGFGNATGTTASQFDNFQISSLTSGTTYSGGGTASGIGSASDTNTLTAEASGTASGVASVTGNGTLILPASGTSSGIASATGNGTLLLPSSGTASGAGSATGNGTLIGSGPTTYSGSGTASGVSSAIGNSIMVMVAGGTASGIASAIGNATGTGWTKLLQPSTTWNKINTPTNTWTKGG